ncbi:MAG: hypothetical protein IPP93_14040 [Chitinophagaceae bacterium]|nr:hypothetical protein [Chitinophagaceae bacterium]MBL0334872.1 hypothetical protein [Chitinophagaceae bacterium]
MLTEREQKMMAVFEKQLAMPASKHILIFGVLSFGLSLLIIITIVDIFFGKGPSTPGFWNGFLVNLVMAPIAGGAYGFLSRRMMAKRYAALKEKESQL